MLAALDPRSAGAKLNLLPSILSSSRIKPIELPIGRLAGETCASIQLISRNIAEKPDLPWKVMSQHDFYATLSKNTWERRGTNPWARAADRLAADRTARGTSPTATDTCTTCNVEIDVIL